MSNDIDPRPTHARRRPSIATRLLAFVALVFAAVPFLGSSSASAHTASQSYVYLEIFDTAIAGRVEYPIADLNAVTGLEIEPDADDAVDQIEADFGVIEAYTRAHLSLGPTDGSTLWDYEFDEIEVLDLGGRSYAVLNFEVAQRFDPPPRTFAVDYDGIIESNSERDAFLLIATDWGSGTFNNEANTFLRFTAGDSRQIVDLDDTSWFKGMTGVIELGAEHIRIGTDHILFVFALVLPSVLVFTRRPSDGDLDSTIGAGGTLAARGAWQPSSGFVPTLWRVLKIVTMFTIAHSITLALGGLGVVELSPRLVESIIALSIAAAALHNIRPIFVNKEWALAFGFGLFHGFGFAGLLSELGLDRSNRFPSLLGFNIGVELGQAAIILMVFPMLFIVRRTRFYLPAMYAGSVALALVALAWATERIFDYDLSVNSIIDPVLRWPRSALLVGAGYLIATAIWWRAKQSDSLLPVASTTESDDVPSEDEGELVGV